MAIFPKLQTGLDVNVKFNRCVVNSIQIDYDLAKDLIPNAKIITTSPSEANHRGRLGRTYHVRVGRVPVRSRPKVLRVGAENLIMSSHQVESGISSRV